MNLVGVEVRRFWARRAVAVVLLVTTLLGALLVASAVWSTRPPTAAELQDAQSQIAAMGDSWKQEVARCERAPEKYVGPGSEPADCQQLRPQPEWYVGRSELDLRQELDARGVGLVLVLVGAAVVLASTFSGADWSSGALGTQLLFEPRRLRVWAAKALAVTLSVTFAAALLSAVFWAVLYATAGARGIEVPREVSEEVLAQTARGLVLVAGAALGTHALTMLLRSTVGTLGMLFGYVVAGEIVVASLPFDRMSQWSLANNVQAFVGDGIQVYDDSICGGASDLQGGCEPIYQLGVAHGAAYLAVLLAVAVVLSAPSFRRRDVA